MIGHLRIAFVLISATAILFVLLPLHLIALIVAKLGWAWPAGVLPFLFHKILLMLFGVRVTMDGHLSKTRPLLLVANHVSWLDIVVLGSIAPLSFVAKSEMADWPLFGTLAKLQRTVFVKREERRKAGQQASEIANRMTAREIMVLFPEGTTSDGHQLLPFKTPLFEAAKLALISSPVENAVVQPVAINYTRLHGMTMGRAKRSHVAWPGEIGLGESLFPIIREGALDVTLHMGEPIVLNESSNRKVISAKASKSIQSMLLS